MASILPMIGLGANIVGTGLSVGGELKAGNDALATAQFNANKATQEAAMQEQQQRYSDQRIISQAKATVGSSGVEMSGSPLDVLAESARQAELNALNIRRAGALEAQGQLIAGKNAQTASRYGAAGTLLTQGYKITNQAIDLNRKRKPGAWNNNGTLPLTPNAATPLYVPPNA